MRPTSSEAGSNPSCGVRIFVLLSIADIGYGLTDVPAGVYTIMFAMTMYTIYQKRRDGVNKFTTVTLVLL